VDEEPYSCTVKIPDDGIAKGSAKNAALLAWAAGVFWGRRSGVGRWGHRRNA